MFLLLNGEESVTTAKYRLINAAENDEKRITENSAQGGGREFSIVQLSSVIINPPCVLALQEL